MEGRRIYAHWLDPEYFAHRWLNSYLATRRFELLGLLKMRAVLGDTFCLSDMQITDSRLVFELFTDPDFRAFIDEDNDFIRLVSEPTEKFAARSEKLGVIEAGLARVVEGWTSSTFSTPQFHIAVADHVFAEKPRDEQDFKHFFGHEGSKIGKIIAGFETEEQRQLVRGMVNAFHYFCSHPQCIESLRVEKRTSYFEVLTQSESRVEPEWKSELQDLITYIKRNTNKQNRGKRSPIIKKLAGANLQDPRNLTRYMNILQAWNLGVARSVRPTHHSGYYFPNAVPFPFLFGSPSEINIRINASDDDILRDIEKEKWHPNELSWRVVGLVRSKCKPEILTFQANLGDDGAWKNLLKAISETIVSAREGSRLLGGITRPRLAWSPWLTGGAETGIGAHLFGAHGLTSQGAERVEQLSALAEFCKLIAEWAEKVKPAAEIGLLSVLAAIHKLVVPYFRNRKTASAIDEYALRYNLRPNASDF